MIEYRLAQPFDAEAIANRHARSWCENNRRALHNAGVSTMKTHGGAVARNCRYTWSRLEGL
ncbi:MAG: hypothetical protein H6641_20935 [Caldilineaceae bacterium]|nr:hypothetical protein [Caldilineaceae bacterium]